mmetsp:Transcript_75290/g.190980  ORF Transcript_75290/g.190980 Transcript_75290/m.190980 type:complete len:218 (-) Transcript_75290:1504-2157(-)
MWQSRRRVQQGARAPPPDGRGCKRAQGTLRRRGCAAVHPIQAAGRGLHDEGRRAWVWVEDIPRCRSRHSFEGRRGARRAHIGKALAAGRCRPRGRGGAWRLHPRQAWWIAPQRQCHGQRKRARRQELQPQRRGLFASRGDGGTSRKRRGGSDGTGDKVRLLAEHARGRSDIVGCLASSLSGPPSDSAILCDVHGPVRSKVVRAKCRQQRCHSSHGRW